MVKPLLGSVAWQYSKLQGAIYENQADQVVEFWPAAYTQSYVQKSTSVKGAAEVVNRQEFYRRLYEEAIENSRELELFPFQDYEYGIDFIPEPNNRYDPFALRIDLTMPGKEWVNEYHIGYVPAKINQVLLSNRERISDIKILAVTSCLNDRFYCARIAVGYDGVVLNQLQNDRLKRFRKL